MSKLKISPSALGLLVFMTCICVSAVLIVKGYMPYREYLNLSGTCTVTSRAKVIEEGQEKEGIYYYGPKVAYYDNSLGSSIHADLINTVEFKQKLKKDDVINIMYDPSDYSLVMIQDDKSASDKFRMMNTIASVLFGVGMAFLAVMVFTQFIRTRPKKFETDPEGDSFEEWQKKKQLEEIARDTAGDKEAEDGKKKS